MPVETSIIQLGTGEVRVTLQDGNVLTIPAATGLRLEMITEMSSAAGMSVPLSVRFVLTGGASTISGTSGSTDTPVILQKRVIRI
jgi:hypothetical protein